MASAPPPPSGKIQHIVLIVQENRTPDNLFHAFRNADIAESGVDSTGQTIPLTSITLSTDYDLSHAHSAFLDMYDNGKMDGADKITVQCAVYATNCPHPFAQFHFVDRSEVQPYFEMAELLRIACFKRTKVRVSRRTNLSLPELPHPRWPAFCSPPRTLCFQQRITRT